MWTSLYKPNLLLKTLLSLILDGTQKDFCRASRIWPNSSFVSDMFYRIGVSFILFAIVLYSWTAFRTNILPFKSKTGEYFTFGEIYALFKKAGIFRGIWENFSLLKSQPRLIGSLCEPMALKWYYIASFCNTFNVKCPVSGTMICLIWNRLTWI